MKLPGKFLNVVDRAAGQVRRWRWPARTAAALCVASVAVLAASQFLMRESELASERAADINKKLRRNQATQGISGGGNLANLAAPSDRHMEDVRDVFQLAQRFEVHLASAQYEPADASAGDFLVRRISLAARDDYPQLKALLEAILANAPHAYLASIRLERPEPANREVNAAFTLAFVYEVPVPGRAPAPAVARHRAWVGSAEVKADPFLPLGTATASAKAEAPTPAPAPPPPKQAAASPPPPPAPPSAPAMPFQAIGSIVGADVAGGAPVAFLMQRDQMLVVKVGDNLVNTYRIDAITAQEVELTYLPLMQKQSLRFQP